LKSHVKSYAEKTITLKCLEDSIHIRFKDICCSFVWRYRIQEICTCPDSYENLQPDTKNGR